MPSREDAPPTRPVKAPRWVSPWSFEDEWEDEQVRHARSMMPAPVKPQGMHAAASVSSPSQPRAPEPGAVSAKPVSQPMVVSLHEEVAGPAPPVAEVRGAVELPPKRTPETPMAPQADLDQRFRPPSPESLVKPMPEPVPASPPAPSTSGRFAQKKTAFQPVDVDVPPAQTPLKRSGPVPNSVRRAPGPAFPWGTLLTSLLGVAGLVLLGSIYLIDAQPVSDEDLSPKVPVDTAPKIAGPERLGVFLQAVNILADMELAMKPAWKWNMPTLQSFIQGNESAIDAFRDLLGDFDWHPHHAAWHQEDLGEHRSWPHVRILLQARVIYLQQLGDEKAAFSAALDLGRLSRRIQEMWSWPSYSQRAQEMHMACVQVISQLLKDTRLSSAELKRLQDDFAGLTPLDDQLQGALSALYIHEKKRLFGARSGEPLDTMPGGVLQERPGRLFFKKHETLGLFADACRQLRDEVVETPFSAPLGGRQPLVKARQTLWFQPNGAGNAYFLQFIGLARDLPQRHHLGRTRHGLVLSLFGIRRYLADHHKLPSGLSDLRPDYLADIPIDPYSGESLHYDPLAGLLFSVGADFRSESGHITEPPLADPNEPTVDLGVAVAKEAPLAK